MGLNIVTQRQTANAFRHTLSNWDTEIHQLSNQRGGFLEHDSFFKVLTDIPGHSDCPVSSTGLVIQSTKFEYTNMMVSFHQLYYDIQIYNTKLR